MIKDRINDILIDVEVEEGDKWDEVFVDASKLGVLDRRKIAQITAILVDESEKNDKLITELFERVDHLSLELLKKDDKQKEEIPKRKTDPNI